MSGHSRARLYGVLGSIVVAVIALTVAGWALFSVPSQSGTEVTPGSSGPPNSIVDLQKTIDITDKEVNREQSLFVIQTYATCVTTDYYTYSEQSKVDCRERMNLANSYCDNYHLSVCDDSKRADFKILRENAAIHENDIVRIVATLSSMEQQYFFTLELVKSDGTDRPGEGKAIVEFLDINTNETFFQREFVVSADDPAANSDFYGYYQFNIPYEDVVLKKDKFKAQVTYIQASDGKQFSTETEIYCSSYPC